VPEAEFAALALAREAGISVADSRLVAATDIAGLPDWATAAGGQALLVRRFDRRSGNGRVHFEELAQVLEVPTARHEFRYRYANFETVSRVTAALCGPQSLTDVIDRLVLNVLIGNGDAHTKNWAYCYCDGRTPSLSPAYDIVPTVLYISGDDLGLKLAGSRRFEDVRASSFERLAIVAGRDPSDGSTLARQAVERVVEAWATLSANLPSEVVRRLTERRDSLPLLWR
jgi:serine/threonine-protein kinase HipA